ncbi:MAG: Fic family protein [Proteobacteria bacterium]|nr:Fic family protein [Pseudomonadota bacterium]
MAPTDRKSEAVEPQLIADPDEQARVEAANGLRQYDHVVGLVQEWTAPERTFRLRPSMLLGLQRTALEGLSSYAGTWRPADVRIGESTHTPPQAHLVPGLIEDMCDYVNDNFATRTAIHLAAYVMWRLNWIHPFTDGNGRTSRAASYFVLCVKSGNVLPGKKTIPEQIATNKKPYYEALEAADKAWRSGQIDLKALEELLAAALATQLADYYRAATGQS